MSVLDQFLPPPGAPGAVRDGASYWRATGDALARASDGARERSSVLTGSWRGPASEAFQASARSFLTSLDLAAAELRSTAGLLDALADAIEQAQSEYHHRVGMLVATGVIAVGLTGLTLGASDEVGAAVVGAELGAATEVAATAATSATAALAQVCAQAARLALQAAVFTGVGVTADAASALVAYGDGRAWAHLDLRGDLELGLVGAVAAPLRAVMAVGARGLPAGLGAGVVGRVATPLVLTGASMASADTLVRLAFGEHVDPAELAMAAIPVGPRAKRLLDGERAMIGEHGTRVTSSSPDGGKGWRLDVENPNPGQRAGQIHLQDYDKGKWLYDLSTGKFIDMPRNLEARLMRDPKLRKALHKAFRILGEEVD